MSFKPAGLEDSSDGDFDDDFEFSLAQDHPQEITRPSSPRSRRQSPPREPVSMNYDLHLEVLTACMMGELSTVDAFLDAGHDVNAFLSSGWTPLLYACNALQSSLISHLLNRGADPNKHKDGYSPLMAVSDAPHGVLKQYLDCLSVLLEAKADPNATSKDRRTPLMFACKTGQPEVVLELLQHTKDIDFVDTDGRSAIFYAVTSNHPEIVKIMMKNGASVKLQDRRDLTIRDIASMKGFSDILEILEFEEGEIESFCPVGHIREWSDAFPSIRGRQEELVNVDVAAVLYALGLDKYRPIFKGMELEEFLRLTDKDLIELGIDLEYHRKIFLSGLMQFHMKKWSHLSLGNINRTISHTIWDGIVSLGTIARQIGVIGSSFRFINTNISKLDRGCHTLSDMQNAVFKDELKKTEDTLGFLRRDLKQMLLLAEKVKKQNVVQPPPEYIGPDKKRKMMNWPIILGATLMAGFYLSKTGLSTRLWN